MPAAGPFTAELDGRIAYQGNRLFQPVPDIRVEKPHPAPWGDVATILSRREYVRHLALIDSQVFRTATSYLSDTAQALWANLPLTTKMISSPGAVYRGQQLNYTTDTLPLEIPDWFSTGERVFLSESSQLYLELLIAGSDVERAFSIYNSFRKERSDFSHLTEFQHIEFEGKLGLSDLKKIIGNLVDRIIVDLLENCPESLLYFLRDDQIVDLEASFSTRLNTLTFEDAMRHLARSTGKSKYQELSLANFGAWEEIYLTDLVGGHLCVEGFPLLQIPFYHAESDAGGAARRAKNADVIFSGYREVVGAGERIKSKEALLEKARIFHLPMEDYEPYLISRDLPDYQTTSGFGLGWQRLLQWVLKVPTIADATVFPRTHLLPHP